MPKKPNTQHTGFYWYMQEQLPRLKDRGLTFPNGLADVVPFCRPGWKVVIFKSPIIIVMVVWLLVSRLSGFEPMFAAKICIQYCVI